MSSEQPVQIEIDFLPARYREECAQRKTHLLRILSVALFTVVLLGCFAWQWNEQRKLALELEVIAPIHESAHERTVRLTTLKNELVSVSEQAELLTYLRHPWPRTQLLAAVIEPMPESVKLSELTIARQEEEENSTALLPSQNARNSTRTERSSEEKEASSPSQADLKALRAEFDTHTTIIQMAGETTNISELHDYLSEIARHPLILKAELRSIESGGRDAVATLFRARIEVRPGYGQPGGPTRAVEEKFKPVLAPSATQQARQLVRVGRMGS